jgi:hypothetical protein
VDLNVGLLNGAITLKILPTNTAPTFWAKSITDEIYRTGGYSLGSYTSRFHGLPRSFGGTITERFGGP